ncbi:MAG: carboxypeptidase M32 [Bacillota bacterium]
MENIPFNERVMAMKRVPGEYPDLTQRMAAVRHLSRLAALARWDMQCNMPGAGAEARKEQLVTLAGLIHRHMTDPRIGDLLYRLRDYADSLHRGSDEAATLRVIAREYRKATLIPEELVRERATASSEGLQAWLRAREERDFSLFLPALRRNLELSVCTAEALDPGSSPLDVLIDEREPGFDVDTVESVFADLKEVLIPLIAEVSQCQDAVDDAVLHQYYDPGTQWDLTLKAVQSIGFDTEERGRQNISVHPFTTSLSIDDVRITTRIREHDFAAAFFASLHEAGHGTYEQGFPRKWEQSVLGASPSGGLHESQSRLWENLVGRSPEFWEFFYPEVKAHFPAQTEGVSHVDFYRAINRVQPSLIRVEADEVTYNLHIIIRFELEKAAFDGDLPLEDMPGAWNEKFDRYLGIVPEDPVEGVLQDIHWSGGFGSSFVSYALGNVIAAQLFAAALREHPGMKEDFRRGDFSRLLSWMQQKVHACGQKYPPRELILHATGEDFSTEPFLTYIREKTRTLYGLR